MRPLVALFGSLSVLYGKVGGAGDITEQFIGRLLFRERFLQEGRGLRKIKLIGPGYQRAIARNLVMLDRLSRGDKARIHAAQCRVPVRGCCARDLLATTTDISFMAWTNEIGGCLFGVTKSSPVLPKRQTRENPHPLRR